MVDAGGKLGKHSGVQSVQVKLFQVRFLGNLTYACSFIRGFSQPEGSSKEGDT